MTDTKKLERLIENSGYKRSFLAAQIGISPYALLLKMNNKTEFKASEIEALCKLLDVDIPSRMDIFFAQTVD